MIDAFNLARFETALPRTAAGIALWTALGVRSAEHCYLIAVKPGIAIYVRSSLGPDGLCAESGDDSIRCWLTSDENGTPLGSKNERWISRVNGWDRRMTETLRTLWRLGTKLRPCPACAVTMHALKVKKAGPNAGRFFQSCPKCGRFDGWLTDVKKPESKEMKSA